MYKKTYEFSVPMPYTLENINELFNINRQTKKSKITSLYGCLPATCNLFTGFEQSRNFLFKYSN